MVKGFIRHHQLHEALQHRVARMFVKVRECTHRQPFQQHLHADELFIDDRRLDQAFQQITQDFANGVGSALSRSHKICKPGDVASFFSGLIGRIFLRARIQQNIGEAGRQVQRPLFAMNDI